MGAATVWPYGGLGVQSRVGWQSPQLGLCDGMALLWRLHLLHVLEAFATPGAI